MRVSWERGEQVDQTVGDRRIVKQDGTEADGQNGRRQVSEVADKQVDKMVEPRRIGVWRTEEINIQR